MSAKKLHFNRLIRDKVLDKLKAKGLEYKVKKLQPAEFISELKNKIPEEAEGVLGAKNRQELMREIGDLAFVIEEFKKAAKIKPAEFKKVMQANFKEKGGFKNKIYLYWTSDDGYRTNERNQN